MYTQTGYDASAHICEETKGAALGAAKGVWRSVFWAGTIGWLVLLAITFAAANPGLHQRPGERLRRRLVACDFRATLSDPAERRP